MSSTLFSFKSVGITFNLEQSDKVADWIESCLENENFLPGEITFIFTNDEYLLKMNQEYLKHDTYTDVISFDYSTDDVITGDVFISIERVRENALKYDVSERDELHRVMIHGILHFCGYNDGDEAERSIMREKEDYCLSLRTF